MRWFFDRARRQLDILLQAFQLSVNATQFSESCQRLVVTPGRPIKVFVRYRT